VIHSEESEAAFQHFYPIPLLQEYSRTLPSTMSVPTIAARVPPSMTLSKKFIFPPSDPESEPGSPGLSTTPTNPMAPNTSIVVLWNDVGVVVPNPSSFNVISHSHSGSSNPNPFPFPPWYPESAHFVRQWWPTLAGLPRLSCTVVLLAAHDQVTHRTRFVLAQHYFRVPMLPSLWARNRRTGDADDANKDLLLPNGGEAQEDQTDNDPLMRLWYVSTPFEVVCVLDGMEEDDDGGAGSERPRPLVAVDFGHAVWIEYVDNEEDRATRAAGEGDAKWLRFVTFPAVGEDASLETDGKGVVRTLEVPDELDLDSVETINIDQSQGAVILSVKEGKIFILCYE
jgi:hypothetical protein